MLYRPIDLYRFESEVSNRAPFAGMSAMGCIAPYRRYYHYQRRLVCTSGDKDETKLLIKFRSSLLTQRP